MFEKKKEFEIDKHSVLPVDQDQREVLERYGISDTKEQNALFKRIAGRIAIAQASKRAQEDIETRTFKPAVRPTRRHAARDAAG